MKHAITILGVATVLAGVTPAVYAQPTQTLLAQSRVLDLSQQGEAKLESGDYKGALEAYNQALQVNANDINAYINRGMARFELGDKKGAINDFTQALQLNPNDANVYRKRGGIYLILGKKKKAMEDLRQAARLSGERGGEANSQQTQNPQTQLQR